MLSPVQEAPHPQMQKQSYLMLGGVWVTYQGLAPKRILAGSAPPITSACPNSVTAPGAGCEAKTVPQRIKWLPDRKDWARSSSAVPRSVGMAFPYREGFIG